MNIEYVLGFYFTGDLTKVALIKKSRPKWQAGKLNGIGGKVNSEKNELPAAAMIREFKEETGADVISWRPFARILGDDYTMYCYASCGDAKLKTAEDEQVDIFQVSDVANYGLFGTTPVVENVPWLVEMARMHLNMAMKDSRRILYGLMYTITGGPLP